MKAIVKVHQQSVMAAYNLHTFEVKEILSANVQKPIFALNINGATTDFTATEIVIVDFQSEIQNAYDSKNWGGGNSQANYDCLISYAISNKIKVEELEYNCPA